MKWTDSMHAYVREHYGRRPTAELARELGCTVVAVKSRARLLGVTMRSLYSSDEDAVILQQYAISGCAWVAKRLGRTTSSIYRRAEKLGVAKRRQCASDKQVCDAILELHPLGWSDQEISVELGTRLGIPVDRHRVNKLRRSLGKRSNVLSPRRRRRVAEKTAEQLSRMGLTSMGQLRCRSWDAWKAELGWPTDLKIRSVQALEILWRCGPVTRLQLCALMGIKSPSRTCPKSNARGGTVLAELQRAGLVGCLRKAVRNKRNGPYSHQDLYFLLPGVQPNGREREFEVSGSSQSA